MDEVFKLIKIKSSIIILSIILVFINCKFFDLLKLSNGEYFIILNTGFYIYDDNFNLNKTVYTFDRELYTCYKSKISEYLNKDEIYIIGFYDYGYYDYYDLNYFQNYSLYIYNYNNRKFNLSTYSYKKSSYSLDDYLSSEIEDLSKIKFENVNISKIKDSIYLDYKDSFDYKSYCYNLNFFGENNSKLIGDCKSNCIIFSNSSTISCFYSNKNYLFNIEYNINSSEPYLNDGLNIFQKSVFSIFYYLKNSSNSINIHNIKFSTSNNNNVFVCSCLKESEDHSFIPFDFGPYPDRLYTVCNLFYTFGNYTEIPCIYVENCHKYKTFYFQETNEFILLCKFNYEFVLSIFKNEEYYALDLDGCHTKIISINCNNYDDLTEEYYNSNYSLIYNNTIKDYIIVIDKNFKSSTNCEQKLLEDNWYLLNRSNNNLDYPQSTSINSYITESTSDKLI